MLREQNVLCISSIDWDFIWQGHQEIMSRLAADGHRVLFVENTGVRAPQVRDLGRVRQRIRNWWRGTKGFREERPNLFVYSPLVLPLPYSRIALWINRLILFNALRRWMRAMSFYRPIVWTFLPTPLAHHLIEELDPPATIYYCIDDLAASSPGARRIAPSEEKLFRTADLVFVTSERLRERAARFSRNVHLFPFGVNLERFEQARQTDGPPPPELQALGRPIVGYVGGLHRWVDQELLVDVAARLPQATFALVGPVQTDVSALERCPNMRLVGQRPHAELPQYIKRFDVGIVPYRDTEYTANVYPTKLNEYLAMGVPVVATDLAEIRRFNAENGGVISVAPGAEGFAAAISDAVRRADAGMAERRIDVARRNSWSQRVADMMILVEQTVADKTARRESWDQRFTKLYRVARRRTLQSVIAAVAAYLLVFQTPLVWWLAEPLRISAPPETADAIVVFAGGVGESGQAGGGYQERVAAAVDLFRAGRAPRAVFSSGFHFVFHEAEVMKDLAVANGMPADAILLEQNARNTHENVLFTDAILRDHGWRKILLVSSPYHMRRALLTWRRSAPDVTVVPTPVSQSLFYLHERGPTVDQIRGIVQEYAAIVLYWWRGWI
jgi:uncharacterized SAM-binding protein YcdF (DUF218 family)/glycosyltransferase involved in cell wall biosynthesis